LGILATPWLFVIACLHAKHSTIASRPLYDTMRYESLTDLTLTDSWMWSAQSSTRNRKQKKTKI